MPEEPPHLVHLLKVCPRCHCNNLKFLFYNNRSACQPRYKCLGCFKDFTLGGRIRESNSQQPQQQSIGRIGVQGTIEGEVRTCGEGGLGGEINRNVVNGDFRRSDRLAPKATEVQVVSESLAHNPAAAFRERGMVEVEVHEISAFPPEGQRGMLKVEVREITRAAAVANPVAIPRYGDEVIVEGASNIWVKAVLGSAPYDLARVQQSPNNTRSTSTEDRGTELR